MEALLGAAGTAQHLKHWGRILGRNLDEKVRVFLLVNSSHLFRALLEIYIFANSRNLLQFQQRRKEENLIENQNLPTV